jgi:hypothetical protein
MRFALAVIAAAALDLAVLLRIDQWFGVAAVLAVGYLLLASAGAGFFAGTRPLLAGGLAVICAALLSGLVQYAPRTAYANDLGVLAAFELQLLTAFVPFAIGGAIAGHIGGIVRRRVVRVGRARHLATAGPGEKDTRP